MTHTEEFIGRLVPPHLFEYAQRNNANMFWYKQAFEKVRNKENPIASTFTRNWVYKTEFELPGMLRWSEVKEEPEMQEAAPIVSAVDMLMRTNWGLGMMWTRLTESIDSVNMNDLDGALTGVVLPLVGGGMPMMEKAFLTEEYAKEFPEHKDHIESLKHEVIKQVGLINKLLPIYDDKMGTKTATQDSKRDAFTEFHDKTKERTSGYGKVDENTFMVSHH